MSAKKESADSAPSLERGLKILEYLALHPGCKGQTEIAQVLKFPSSSVFRITMTL